MKKQQHCPDDCTACTSCVANCPVTAATRHFCGPKMAGPALERFRRMEPDENHPALDFCSNCKNCDITCPSGVPISTMNVLAKAEYYKTHSHSMRDWILSHSELLGRLGSPAPWLTNLGMSNPISKAIMQRIGIAAKAPLPKYAAQTFIQQFRSLKQQSFVDKVVFFPGCFINYNDPGVGLDLVAVMQANQYQVIVPDTECCGSPLVANAYLEEAEAKAQHNIAELKHWIDQGYDIITCCTSCGLMLKREYQELFEIEGMQAVAAKVYDAAEFLLELYDQGRLNLNFVPQEGRYLYHSPCHLRAQGIGRPSLELLQLAGIEIADVDGGCCGLSGNYGFKADKYDIAMAVGDPLFTKIKESNINTVVSDCGICRVQIAHGAGVQTAHPLTLLRKAYGV
ncbi:MAG TPA: anaerobic glycerol-3-phosphate dehydrogenase subunit C [Negativicutes bacterium]